MKFRRKILSLFTCALSAACVPSTNQNIPPILTSSETTTVIPSPTATPSMTQIPMTSTITPLPTIPTFTPTFDVKTIVTATPAPQVECPKEDAALKPSWNNCDSGGECYIPKSEEIANYLNSGGTLDKVKYVGDAADFTGNGAKELLAYTNSGSFDIYGCNDGNYQMLQEFKGAQRTP